MTRNTRYALAILFGLPVLMLLVWVVADLAWLGLPLEIAAIVGAVFACRRTISKGFFETQVGSTAETPLSAALPSAADDVNFRLSASVCWRSTDRLLDERAQAELATDAIVNRALRLAAPWGPEQWEVAGHKLAAALSAEESDEAGKVLAWAADVQLELLDTDRIHLDSLAEARRQTELWTIKVAKERALRAYLKDEALSSADAAVVWWLSRNESSVERAVELSEVLSTLSDLASGKSGRGGGGMLVEAIHKLADEEQRPLADEIAHSLTDAGLIDEAQTLRETFHVRDHGAQLYDIAKGGRIPPIGEPQGR